MHKSLSDVENNVAGGLVVIFCVLDRNSGERPLLPSNVKGGKTLQLFACVLIICLQCVSAECEAGLKNLNTMLEELGRKVEAVEKANKQIDLSALSRVSAQVKQSNKCARTLHICGRLYEDHTHFVRSF